MTDTLLATPLGPFDLEITRHLKARRAVLWRCWTEPALMEQWFCPKPWRATGFVVDLRPGGAFSSVFHGPAGEVFENPAGCFLHVVPEEALVWTSGLGPGWRPLIAAAGGFAMTAIITFRDAAGGGTVYTARAVHADEAAKAQHEAMGFHGGWGTAAAQLDELALTL